MLAGLPVTVPGTTVNRFCSSGLQAIAMAAHQIVNEGAEAAIGGGVESISITPRDTNPHPQAQSLKPGLYMVMGATAEVVGSVTSQQRMARAQHEGFFAGEIAPMQVTYAVLDRKAGEAVGTQEACCGQDECNRPAALGWSVSLAADVSRTCRPFRRSLQADLPRLLSRRM